MSPTATRTGSRNRTRFPPQPTDGKRPEQGQRLSPLSGIRILVVCRNRYHRPVSLYPSAPPGSIFRIPRGGPLQDPGRKNQEHQKDARPVEHEPVSAFVGIRQKGSRHHEGRA